MAKIAVTINPSPGPKVDGFAEVSHPWPVVHNHLHATQWTIPGQGRSELALAGAAMAEHVEDSLHADAEIAFLDAAEAAASCYERALAEARLSQPEQAHSLHLLELDDGGNPARGIVFAVILGVPFWVIAALIVHRLL